MAISEKLLDKRIVTRNLQKGTLDAKSYQGFLEALPDLTSQAEPLVQSQEASADEASDSAASASNSGEEPSAGE